ncbi:hypothetical protein T484DRAFT_1918405, partial [Baffinella frigidus]
MAAEEAGKREGKRGAGLSWAQNELERRATVELEIERCAMVAARESKEEEERLAAQQGREEKVAAEAKEAKEMSEQMQRRAEETLEAGEKLEAGVSDVDSDELVDLDVQINDALIAQASPLGVQINAVLIAQASPRDVQINAAPIAQARGQGEEDDDLMGDTGLPLGGDAGWQQVRETFGVSKIPEGVAFVQDTTLRETFGVSKIPEGMAFVQDPKADQEAKRVQHFLDEDGPWTLPPSEEEDVWAQFYAALLDITSEEDVWAQFDAALLDIASGPAGNAAPAGNSAEAGAEEDTPGEKETSAEEEIPAAARGGVSERGARERRHGPFWPLFPDMPRALFAAVPSVVTWFAPPPRAPPQTQSTHAPAAGQWGLQSVRLGEDPSPAPPAGQG